MQEESSKKKEPFAACKRYNRRRCMWAYLIGLSIVAMVLVHSHYPLSISSPAGSASSFVDSQDLLERSGQFISSLIHRVRCDRQKRNGICTNSSIDRLGGATQRSMCHGCWGGQLIRHTLLVSEPLTVSFTSLSSSSTSDALRCPRMQLANHRVTGSHARNRSSISRDSARDESA